MKKYKRIFTIVIDSLGIGAMPNAAEYDDEGTDTLGHIDDHMTAFRAGALSSFKEFSVHNKACAYACA